MKRVVISGLLLTILFLARPVCANIVINVGNISLAPNEAGQQREVYVSTDSGTTDVEGLEFYVRVGAGDGSVIGPTISGLDVVGDSTLFSTNNSGPTYPDVLPQFRDAFVTTATGSVPITTSPVGLALVTFDTTGLSSGSWALSLSSPTEYGFVTNFAPTNAVITDGTITINNVPEPSMLVMLGGMSPVLLVWWRYRRGKR